MKRLLCLPVLLILLVSAQSKASYMQERYETQRKYWIMVYSIGYRCLKDYPYSPSIYEGHYVTMMDIIKRARKFDVSPAEFSEAKKKANDKRFPAYNDKTKCDIFFGQGIEGLIKTQEDWSSVAN